MPNAPYEALLDATIQHLEALRELGVRYVEVNPQLLAALTPGVGPNRAVRPPADGSPAASHAVANAPKPPPVGLAGTSPQPPQLASPGMGRPASAPAHPPPAQPVLPGTVALPTGPAPGSLFAGAPRRGEMSPAEKETAMAALRQRVMACVKCPHLAAARRNVAFGVGDIHSPLMFVGEAPGMDEDAQGEPFVGRAGQLLTRIIQTMGLSRERVYIANILKCRPDTPGQTSGNRKPTATEMATCLPYLLEQIEIIQPRVIVALGATAVEGLFGKASAGITRARGKWLAFRDIPVMPTYHPAYLLRNQALTEKRKVWEDMLAVMERLGLPISEKQRGYFLKA